MKNLLLVAFLSLAFSAIAQPNNMAQRVKVMGTHSHSSDTGGYFTGSVGTTKLREDKIEDVTFAYDRRVNLSAGYGWDFGNYRVEGVLNYLPIAIENDIDFVEIEADVQIYTIMLNAWRDFEYKNNWFTYVGAGIGWGDYDVDPTTKFGDSEWKQDGYDGSDLALQLGGGAGYHFTENTSATLDYRFVKFTDNDLDEDEYQTFNVGVIHRF